MHASSVILNHGACASKKLTIFRYFDPNESDNTLILLERRFDVIFTSFSSSIKVLYFF